MKLLIAAGFILFSLHAKSDTFYVQETSAINVSKEDAQAVTELIRSSVSESTKHQAVTTGANASYTLKPKILKLGNSYMLTIDKVKNDQVIFSTQMKASSIEELDRVSKRVVRAVIDQVSAGSDSRVEDLTQSEIAEHKRRETLKRWYFGLGPSFTNNLNNNGSLFGWDVSFNWEMPDAALKIFMEGAGAAMFDFGIGGNYYFSNRDQTPLIMATLGYGSTTKQKDPNVSPYSDEGTPGFILGTGLGYQFFRTSSVVLELLGHYSIMLNKNSIGTPSIYGFRVGLYF